MEAIREILQRDRNVTIIRKVKRKERLFLVGGAVRDLILQQTSRDYDFAVTGSGVKFGRAVARTIKGSYVLMSKEDDEARVVKDDIVFDFKGLGENDIISDLGQRDFTINAMAVELDQWDWYDPFEGVRDLKKKVIRLTTERSLKEDPLRVLRGFRFALELGFSIHREFLKQARDVSLKTTAAERIGMEMMRILAAPDSFIALKRLDELGILRQIFVEALKIIDDPELWSHSLHTYEAVERLMREGFFCAQLEPEFNAYFSIERRKPLLKLAALFHDVAKPDTFLLKEGEVHFYGHDTKGARIAEILGYKRLKLARSDVMILKRLVKEHMRPHLLATNQEVTDRAYRRFFRNLGEDYLGSMMIAWADGYATAGKTRHLEDTFNRMIALKRADEAKPKIDRLINGHDLIELGLVPGPIFKVILQELQDQQLEEKIKTKDEGKKMALEIFKKTRGNNEEK